MPTAAGGPPRRQGSAGARAALVLGRAERDSSCLWERGGKGEPQTGPCREQPARPRAGPPQPPPSAAERRHTETLDTRQGDRAGPPPPRSGTSSKCPAPTSTTASAPSAPPCCPLAPPQRRAAPPPRPPIGCPALPLPVKAAMAPAKAEVLRLWGLLGNGLTGADPAGRRGVSPEVASLGGQSLAAGSVKPAEPLELYTRARSCHLSLGVFASTSGDASQRDVNSNKTIKSNKINNSVLSSGVFALELAVRVVHSQQYPKSLRGIKVAAQGQLGKQRSKHRARPKGCFRGFALILAFLVCCPFSGRVLSSEIPTEASFPPGRCSGSRTPPPSLPPAPHFPPAQAGPTAPDNTSLGGSTSSSIPRISSALTCSLLGP